MGSDWAMHQDRDNRFREAIARAERAEAELAAIKKDRSEFWAHPELKARAEQAEAELQSAKYALAFDNKEFDVKNARIAELETENRMLRSRPSHSRHSYVDGIPSDEE